MVSVVGEIILYIKTVTADINKFLWMVRIAEGEHPQDIRESDYFTERGEFRVDSEGSPTLLNCLMYKLSYYRY